MLDKRMWQNHPDPYFRLLDEITALALVDLFAHHPKQAADVLKNLIDEHIKKEVG